MDIEYIKKNYRFETLTKNHDLSQFESDSDDLNEFLKNDALKQQCSNLNLTKLIVCEGNIIGYFSLLTDTIYLNNIREDIVKKDIKNQLNIVSNKNAMPAVKIGRFAIDKDILAMV